MPKYKDSMELESLTSPELKVYRKSTNRTGCKAASVLTILLVLVVFPYTFLGTSSSAILPETVPFEEWLHIQEVVARRKYLANIGSSANNPDVAAGAVIASPSKEHPDYYYQWVRDAAIVYDKIIRDHLRSPSKKVATMIHDWAKSQDAIQRTKNPSGTYSTGGIGEPKFMVDNSPFTTPWGRPQSDGPALRASALISYAESLDENDELLDYLYKAELPANTVIKADLEYVANSWQAESFDLWEEVKGIHFFNFMVQRKSLLDGARFARARQDPKAAEYYEDEAASISARLDEFWSTNGYIQATLHNDKREGLDCGVILASIHGNAQNTSYSPWSDRMLSTHYKYTKRMQTTYKINKHDSIPGVAVGRYSEDIYDGYGHGTGNPWYLCNAAAAEQLYLAIRHYRDEGRLQVTEISAQFFKQLDANVNVDEEVHATDTRFAATLSAMMKHADSYLRVIQKYVQADGSMSEQFNRDDGEPQGASDLTWSYVAFLTALEAREAIA